MEKQNRIRLLSDDLVGKIAAGEVVDRPASVVKELVENSIDAKGTRIEVEILDGGKKLIRVSDNGVGMNEEDAKIAFCRHATSKILEEKDLFALETMGFRGEALPSIGAVASVELATRQRESSVGVLVSVDAGSLVRTEPVGTPPGTIVTVTRLFHNVPARLKYLKTGLTETRACVQVLSSLALAHPEVAFKLTKDGKDSFSTAGTGRLLDAVIGVYGSSIAKDLVDIHFGSDGVRLRGYVSRPAAARKNRGYQIFSVNGRCVQSNLVRSALEKGFKDYLPRGRYPVGILDIRVPPLSVDANVHPSKLEVKFENEQAVYAAVLVAVKSALRGVSPLRQDEASSFYANPGYQRTQFPFGAGTRKHINANTSDAGDLVLSVSDTPSDSSSSTLLAREIYKQGDSTLVDGQQGAGFRIIGQLDATYILVELQDGLLVVDQHAAHERIIYEKLVRSRGETEVQVLLIPETVELDRHTEQLMKQHLEVFTEAGFDIEDFGGNTYIVRAIPSYLNHRGECDIVGLVQDILDELYEYRDNVGDLQTKLLMSLSCKAAVKAGDALSVTEMKALVSDLFVVSDLYTCPHGRPTAIKMTIAELQRKFLRVL